MKAKLLFSLTFCLSLFFVNATTAAVIHDPVGTYEFVVTDIPDQADVKGTMTVTKTGGVLKVVFSYSEGEINLSDAKLDGHKLTGSFEVQGIIIKLAGTFNSDRFSGQLNAEFGAMGISANKK